MKLITATLFAYATLATASYPKSDSSLPLDRFCKQNTNLYPGERWFQKIGTEGGLLEKPVPATEMLIPPEGRFEILAGTVSDRATFTIQTLPDNQGTRKNKFITLAADRVGPTGPSEPVGPDSFRQKDRINSPDAPLISLAKLHGKRNRPDGVNSIRNDHMHLHDTPIRLGGL